MSTILVVDDMAIFRDPLAASLRLAGYETSCAANGQEALAAIRSRRPDLILLDMAMPVMDGLSFLRALKAGGSGAGDQIPVVVLSAVSDQKQVIEAGALGAGDYLLKSQVSLDEMLDRVRKNLARDGRMSPEAPPTLIAPSPSMTPAPTRATPAVPPTAATGGAGPASPGGLPEPFRGVGANLRVVHLLCPHTTCGRLLAVPPEFRGTLITCAYCRRTLRVPRPKTNAGLRRSPLA